MSLDVELYIKVDTGGEHPHSVRLFEANITHNLNKMAGLARIYECLWSPHENGFKTAGDIVPVLEAGIKAMKADPEVFKQLDSPNGWGRYDDFMPWLEKYLAACQQHPKASIWISK